MLNPCLAERWKRSGRRAACSTHSCFQIEVQPCATLDAEILEGRLRVIVLNVMLGPTASPLFVTAACAAMLYAVFMRATSWGSRRGVSGGGTDDNKEQAIGRVRRAYCDECFDEVRWRFWR